MVRAVVVRQTGDASVMQVEDMPKMAKLKSGQVLVKQSFSGVNFNDIYYRDGRYKVKTPFIPGTEACGIIEQKAEDVDFEIGQRVAYCNSVVGSYCEKRIVNVSRIVCIPNSISDEVAAAVLAKGMVAHMLAFRTYRVQKDSKILVHSAAGGVGQLLCQWASHIGAHVIGAVGGQEKIQTALNNGCKHAFNYNDKYFANQVVEATNGVGVDVAYDSVGKDTFLKSLTCLGPLGLLVSYGHTSGIPDPLNISLLSKKANFITYPLVSLYKSDRLEMALTAREIFKKIEEGVLRANIHKIYGLDEVVKAHQELESRRSKGQIIIKL